MARFDTTKLRKFADRLAAARTAALRPELAQVMVGTVTKLLADGFRKSQDPYGKEWAPLKRERTRNRKARIRKQKKLKQKIGFDTSSQKPLLNTGRMRQVATAAAVGDRVIARVPVEYSRYHQHGTRHMVARKMVPDVGPSPLWTEAMRKNIKRFLKEKLG